MKRKEVYMLHPVPEDPSIQEQSVTVEPAFAFRDSARTAGQHLREYGFQAVAFLLGIALAFM